MKKHSPISAGFKNQFNENHIPCVHLTKVVEFAICLPGTDAATKRVFSIINNLWTSGKSQLNVDTVMAMVIAKCNFECNTCEDFKQQIENCDELLKKVHSYAKYS